MTRIEGSGPQSTPVVEAEPTIQANSYGRLLRVGATLAAPALALVLSEAPAYAPANAAPALEPLRSPSPTAPPPEPEKPNILNVVIDDMNDFSCDNLDAYMPETNRWLKKHQAGTCFENTQSSAPQCSPSRGSIMTGEYPHNSHLRTQSDAAKLNIKQTVQNILRKNGYETYGFGKYLNDSSSKAVNMHPGRFGFDEATFWNSYNYTGYTVFDHDGHRKVIQQNSSPYIGGLTRQAIKQAASSHKPWYVYDSYRGPHNQMEGNPLPRPTRQHVDAKAPPLRFHHEYDLSDKLSLFKKRHLNVDGPFLPLQNKRREQTVMDEDTQLVKTLHLLSRLGILKDTVVVFSSDNGWENGNHGWLSKDDPYRGATAVPMFWIAGDYMEPGVDHRLVSNIDIVPTLLKIAGVKPNHHLDGHSLLSSHRRNIMYTEYFHPGKHLPEPRPGHYTAAIPTWSKLNDKHWSYITFYRPDGQVMRHEYYKNPLELNNVYHSLSAKRKHQLAERLHDLRICAGIVGDGVAHPCN